jgi:hypothetical protein
MWPHAVIYRKEHREELYHANPMNVKWSGWLDSNQRSAAPRAAAFSRLRYTQLYG